MPPQMTSHSGCVLSISLSIASDLAELVIPCATSNATAGGGDATCRRAVQAAVADLVPLWEALGSVHSFIRAISASHMDNGFLPDAIGFAPTDHPGLISGNIVSPEVGALCTFYPYSGDRVPGARLKHSRMIIPGVPVSALTSSGQLTASGAWWTAFTDFCNKLVDGFSIVDGAETYDFYRVLAAPPDINHGGVPNTTLIRLEDTPILRNNLGVQRRRILPH